MAPTPPSTTPSSQGQSPEGQFRVVRKRNRIPLSCGPCRHRKLKCNRAHPCDNCTKRGDTDSCTYASPNLRKKNASTNGANGSPDEMQNRIDRLENLVLSLMTNGPQSAGPTAANTVLAGTGPIAPMTGGSISSASTIFPPDADSEMLKEETQGTPADEEGSEVEQVTKSIGVMKVDSNKAFFIPEAHWYSILAEISEVKNWFSDHKKQYDEQYNKMKLESTDEDRIGMGFLLVTNKPANNAAILREFPPKATCDTLISRFFNTHSYDPAFHIIHGPTFQKQYDMHWLNPNDTPVIWLGMVFSMMVIAIHALERSGEEPLEYRGQLQQMKRDYRRLAAECIIFSDITQPITHMLEALLLFHIGEFARCKDSDAGILLSISNIVRLAMRMGYHRDSKNYPNITPFVGEMRRRVWTVVRQADILFSNQAGMPPMIRGHEANTELPRNLYDDELYEEMKVLPQSRPMNEPTPMCYVIYKAQLLEVFGRILDVVQSMSNVSYEEVMKLDQQLRETHANIPPLFKMVSLEESFRDPPALVMQRYILDVLFLRSQIVLHRKFACPIRDNGRYSYSRRAAIDASMELLKHQGTLHNESRPGGRLQTVKWFVSPLTTHDFLLAAMMVSLDLYNSAEAERTGRRPTNDIYDWSPERRASMISALEQSLSIWTSLREESMEAFKATGILTAMVGKLRAHEAQLRQQRTGGFSSGFGASAFPGQNGVNAADDANVAPEHSAAMTLGMLSTGALTPNTANMFAAMEANNAAAATSQQQAGAPLSATTGATSSSGGSGLTPNYSDQSVSAGNAPVSAPSPFSSFFPAGMSLGFQNMDMPIDWDAWDSYMTGSTVDANGNWAMNLDSFDPGLNQANSLGDGSNMPAATTAGAAQQQQPATSTTGPGAQPQNPANMFAGNVFMGAGTPRMM